MEITGQQLIPAPRQQVWDALTDPVVLKACLPGCESVERMSPERFEVVITSAIGPLRARFKGSLTLTDIVAPQSCVMVFEGQGGAIGFGKGTSRVELSETNEGTALDYRAEAQVGGKLAQVGGRLIDSVARKMSDDFFRAFKRELVPEDRSLSQSHVSADAPRPADAPSHTPTTRMASVPAAPLTLPPNTSNAGLPPWAWLVCGLCTGVGLGLTAGLTLGLLLGRTL